VLIGGSMDWIYWRTFEWCRRTGSHRSCVCFQPPASGMILLELEPVKADEMNRSGKWTEGLPVRFEWLTDA